MRTTTRTTMFVLMAFLIAAPCAWADDALTLQQSRSLTLSRSATLRSTQLAVDAASLAAQAQGYAALPSVSLSGGGSWDFERAASTSLATDTASVSASLSASQTVFDGGRILALVRKYGYATEAARESLRAERISLMGQADSAYYAVLEAQASVEAASSDLDAARLRQSIAQAKIDAGSLSKSAYLQTEADTAGYETSLILARKTLASAKAKLASLTGQSPATSLQPVDFSSYASLLDKLSSLDETTIDKVAAAVSSLTKANSPDLANYALASQQAKLGVAVAKAAYLPSISAGVSQGLSYGNYSAKLGASGSVSLTASMSLDLWNTKNAVDSAAIAAQQTDLSGSQGATDLELSVVQALYEWISSAASIGSAAKALDYAKSNYENVLEEFKLSSATTSDLSTAQALVSVDETALIGARYAFLSNLSTLRGLAGLEDDAPLLAVVP